MKCAISFILAVILNWAPNVKALEAFTPSPLPSRIPRIRAFLIGFKQDNLGLSNIFYTLRVTWTEPYYWNDENVVDTPQHSRGYQLNCFLQTSADSSTRGPDLMNLQVAYDYQGYSEKFQFPADLDLYVQCAVRARNARDLFGQEWKYSDRIRINETPLYLSGFDGINVRGWSDEEIRNLRTRIENAAAAATVAGDSSGSSVG